VTLLVAVALGFASEFNVRRLEKEGRLRPVRGVMGSAWYPRAQVLAVREAARAAVERTASGSVAFVFGSEQAGLTNDEVFACQHLVHIPASDDYSSLNLAQAVQVVAYELRAALPGLLGLLREALLLCRAGVG